MLESLRLLREVQSRGVTDRGDAYLDGIFRRRSEKHGRYIRAVGLSGYTGWEKAPPWHNHFVLEYSVIGKGGAAVSYQCDSPPPRGMNQIGAMIDDANFFPSPSVPANRRA